MSLRGAKQTLLLLFVLFAAPAPASAGVSAAPIQQPQPLQRHYFSIFRTAPEQLPPLVVEALSRSFESGLEADHGFNLALAQEAQPPGHHRPLWVIPGRGYIMLLERAAGHSEIGGATLASTRKAIREGIGFSTGAPKAKAHASSASAPHRYRAVGLVPDGVVAVRLGKTEVARVLNNVYSVDIEQSDLWEHRVFIRG